MVGMYAGCLFTSLAPPDAAAYATSGHLSVANTEFAAIRFPPAADCEVASRCFAPAGVRADAPAQAVIHSAEYRGIATPCNLAGTGDVKIYCTGSTNDVCTGSSPATGALIF